MTQHSYHARLNTEPRWSRANSLFIREYPWDDCALLGEDSRDLLDDFSINGDTFERQAGTGTQLGRNDDTGTAMGREGHYLQNFVNIFLKFENIKVLSPYGQTHAGTIRQFILQTTVEGLNVNGPPSGALLSAPGGVFQSTPKMSMLCQYLAAMRVIDVACTLEGRQRHPKVPKWSGSWRPAKNPALAFLPDIKTLLTKAQHALYSVLPLDDPTDSLTPSLLAVPPPFRIMRELAQSMAMTSRCHIVNNLLLAALHLSWLLARVQGNVDIPETFSNGTLGWEGLSEVDKAQLSKLFEEEDSAYKIRLPLLYSLFISPLVLLRTVCVCKQSMKRAHLITVRSSLSTA
ncbi:hypothetical protein BKA70DRAFT_1240758 [Coprinopsis sp. MPI-PUGE-AT-0042]|nr:hypothetical protein BKA70DRAFT_1240758 [Coprinopsis sp. MPI-PUGE-AT-0042]